MTGAGFKAGMVAAIALALALPAVAQELSENSVKSFMEYAWSLTPAQFTKPSGQVVQIDKKKRDEAMVPVDVARDVIKVGRLSAHAQVCELKDEQINNYRSLMYREEDKKKWSPQQLIYISQLHLTTVMMLTGKLKLVEKQDGKDVVVEELPSKAVSQTCSDEQRAKVKELISAYVATGPALAGPASAAADAAPPAGGAPKATGSVAPASAPAAAPAPKK